MEAISSENILLDKYFAGLFCSPSTFFSDNKRWNIINTIMQYINKKDASPVLFPGAPFADIKAPSDAAFSCQVRNDGLSYSVNPDVPFGKFCEEVQHMGKLYKSEFKDIFFNKIGVVIYFRLKVTDPIEYLKKFLKVPKVNNIRQSQVHINYEEIQNDIKYNFNINLMANGLNKTMKGSLDVNTKTTPKGIEFMSLDQITTIYTYVYDYFKDQNKFIKFLNNEE